MLTKAIGGTALRTFIIACILAVLLSGAACYCEENPSFENLPAAEAESDAGFMVYAAKQTSLFSSADASRTLGTIPAGTVVSVLDANHGMAQIAYQDMTGFSPISAFLAPVSGSQFPVASERYYLFLEKVAFTLTVYAADENGEKTDVVVRSIPVALGKRSTPTPTGIFTLGAKEDWHDFAHTSAPFCIAYTNGRYLHGPLYEAHDFSTLCEYSLEDIGHMRTSGCLRMAYEDAAWLYFHCLSSETTLEIVLQTAAAE